MSAPLPAILEHPFPTPPAPGEAVTAAPGVVWLRMPLPFALDHINVWLLEDTDGWTLVDTGYGDAPTRALWEEHLARTLEGRPLRRIVATHCHPDHVGNAAWLSSRFDCPVVMTHAEFLTAHAIHGQQGAYSPAATMALFRAHGLEDAALQAMAGRGDGYRRGVPELPPSFARLLDQDVLTIGGRDWQVIEGHGHSPEHASLYAGDARLLIAGDMLLPRISTNVSVWPAEPLADPVRRFLESIAEFEALAPDTLVLPSHGLPFRGIAMRVAALRAHHAARLDELAVALALRDGSTAAEVVPVLFTRRLDVHQQFFAMGEAIAHLNHLWHTGRAARREHDGVLRFHSH